MGKFIRESENRPGKAALKNPNKCPDECYCKKTITGLSDEYVCDFYQDNIRCCKHADVVSGLIDPMDLIKTINAERKAIEKWFGNGGKRVDALLQFTKKELHTALRDNN